MAKILKDQDGKEYELVPFKPKDNPQQEGSFLVRPVQPKLPEPPAVKLFRKQWEGSSIVYIGAQFPSRENLIWIREAELDSLYDAILTYRSDLTK